MKELLKRGYSYVMKSLNVVGLFWGHHHEGWGAKAAREFPPYGPRRGPTSPGGYDTLLQGHGAIRHDGVRCSALDSETFS
jgi:hypothetical protein